MRNKFQIILILSLFLLSCTYYNTFYNAKKSFKEGEKAQKGLAPGKKSTTANKKYEEAIKKASKVLTFHPKSKWADDALFLIGRAYYNMGEYAKAERKFKELLASFPKSKLVEECHYYVSRCHYESGNEQDAIQSLKIIVQSSKADKKKRVEAAFMLGEIYFEREEYDDAISHYQHLVENYKKDTLASFAQARIGESCWLKKDYASAKEAFAQMEKYDPKPDELFESKFKSGECCYLMEDFEEGMNIFTRLAKESKDSEKLPSVKLKIAEGILLSGKTEEAIQEYDNIIKDYPKTEHSAAALYQLGMIHQDRFGDLKKAKAMFDSCKTQSPRSKIAQEALTKSANISKVEQYQEQLFEDETEKPGRALFLLAEHYLTQMNQPDSALAEYLILADKYPESEYATKSLYAAAWILQNIKHDTTQAEDIYQRILRDYPGSDYLKPAMEFLEVSPDSLEIDNPEREYLEAERMLLEYDNVDSALVLYNRVIERFPQSIYAGKSAYALAWITEHYANPGDSTVALGYQRVIDEYPNSEYADAARIKLGRTPKMRTPPPPSPQEEEPPEEQLPDTSQVDTTLSSEPSIPMAPQPLKRGEFVYPESEIESGIEATVVLKIMIDFEGKVRDAVLVNKTDNYWIDEAAKKAALETTFDPEKIDMMLLDGWFLYNVEVRPPEADDGLIDQSGMEH
ncbi:MAG: TonB family protein [candidate division Zixibacteria bacterium]|nr:TonB family protein [candidate division Zixibacteria bacterium]